MYTYLLEAVLLEIYKYFTNTTCCLIRDELEAGQYSHLSKLVRQYLCPPPSSLASERSFKVARDTLGDQRLRLLPENAEMNLFLNYNLRAIDHNIDDLENPPATWMSPNRVSAADSDDDSQEMDTSDLSDDDE